MDEAQRPLHRFLTGHPDKVVELCHLSERQVVLLVDGDGTVTYANALFRVLVGENRDPVGQPLSRYLEQGQPWPPAEPDGGGPRQVTVPFCSRDGSIYRFEIALVRADDCLLLFGQRALLTHSEAIARMSEVNEEMVRLSRELTRQSAALKRSNRELESFASVASHDLQAPLRRIEALSGLLRAEIEAAAGEQARDYLERMEKEASRMRRMVDGLLELSRAGTRPLQAEPVDLGALAHELADDLAAALGIRDAKVRIEPVPAVRADPVMMRQLLQNLLLNALQHGKPGGPPDVRLYPEEADRPGWVRFALSDRGVGFDAGQAERIFGIFERLQGSERSGGTGIGLSICRRIVQRHGGSISAQGEIGRGARFTVTLPAHPAGSAPPPDGTGGPE
jgi:signal transduction histidine kinase